MVWEAVNLGGQEGGFWSRLMARKGISWAQQVRSTVLQQECSPSASLGAGVWLAASAIEGV